MADAFPLRVDGSFWGEHPDGECESLLEVMNFPFFMIISHVGAVCRTVVSGGGGVRSLIGAECAWAEKMSAWGRPPD
jgi:hypothetical protein